MRVTLREQLRMKIPIIQAPMAGGMTTPEFVMAVVRNGGFGMLASGYLAPEKLREQISTLKEKGFTSFGVNIFVPSPFEATIVDIENAEKNLAVYYNSLGVPFSNYNLPRYKVLEDEYYQIIDILIEEQVMACSFTFGLPTQEVVTRLKSANIYLMGTATNVQEALAIEEAGFDAIVLQGSEAGGHRGHFIGNLEESFFSLTDLVEQVKAEISLPIIAAGGLMDRADVESVLKLGAEAAQLGTALLVCDESGAHEKYKDILISCEQDTTVLTKAFSGKWARGLQNTFTKSTEASASITVFPIQNALTQYLRKVAGLQGNTDYMALWAGQGVAKAEKMTIEKFLQRFEGM